METFTSVVAADFVTISATERASVLGWADFAQAWYEDALREAASAKGDFHARRREVLATMCCAESYIYEWTRGIIMSIGMSIDTVEDYFPPAPQPGWNRGVTEQWKAVPKQLYNSNVLAIRPDFGGPHGVEWERLVLWRNGLVHANVSRPERYGAGRNERPSVTVSDLAAADPGWATGVIAERIRRLHLAAGTPVPRWLVDP